MYEGFREFFKNSIEKECQEWKNKGINEGRSKGRSEGRNAEKERVAVDMLKENLPLQLIAKISKLSESVIRNLAASSGLAIS